MSPDHLRKLFSLDGRKLAGSVLLLFTALLLSGTAVLGALRHARQTETRFVQALAEEAGSLERLRHLEQDEKDIPRQIERYRALLSRGHLQPERRLAWADTLRQIREQRRLLHLEYEIAPQRLLDEDSAARYRFFASTMKLDMDLLHELDLLGLLADLQTRAEALVVVRRCTMERLNPPRPSPGPGEAQLRAHCEIDWITAGEKS